MDENKRDKVISTVEIGVVALYIFMVLKSTIGKYVKETKKNIKKEAKRKDKLNKLKYKKKARRLKSLG